MIKVIAWDKALDIAINPEKLPLDLEWSLTTDSDRPKYKKYSQYNTPKEPEPAPPIRSISTGAMQRRFTIPEEIFITSDATATVIKSRLLNASYCDLDFQDTIDGVTYICGVLKAGGIIVDDAARIVELLIDGTEDERYP